MQILDVDEGSTRKRCVALAPISTFHWYKLLMISRCQFETSTAVINTRRSDISNQVAGVPKRTKVGVTFVSSTAEHLPKRSPQLLCSQSGSFSKPHHENSHSREVRGIPALPRNEKCDLQIQLNGIVATKCARLSRAHRCPLKPSGWDSWNCLSRLRSPASTARLTAPARLAGSSPSSASSGRRFSSNTAPPKKNRFSSTC